MTFEVEPLAFSQHLNEEIEQFAAVGKTGFFALNMDTLSKIQDISLRIDQLETTGEWLARALVHVDSSGSQAGSMIMALAEDIRERVLELVTDLEQAVVLADTEEDESLH